MQFCTFVYKCDFINVISSSVQVEAALGAQELSGGTLPFIRNNTQENIG